MGLRELLEIHGDCKKFRHIVNRLQNVGFISYEQADGELSEAYEILNKVSGNVPEKKKHAMERAIYSIEEDFENAWLSGAFN